MKQNNGVFATIIAFNPEKILEKNILSIQEQVECLIVIDNKSNDCERQYILELKERFNFELILNSENKGIAVALNQALHLADERNYKYFLTMDQDTILAEGAVETMLSELEKYSLASIGPSYNTDAFDLPPKSINFLITSGNITKTQYALEVGGFDEWLFIDGVDIDFSLKLRSLGYKIAQSKKASMKHSIGSIEKTRFLFIKIAITVHSLKRYYYAERNNLYLRKKHKNVFPYYCFKLKIACFLKKLKILLFYKNRMQIFIYMKQGRKAARNYIFKQ